MFEKYNNFMRKYKKTIISNEDDRFKRDLTDTLEEIVDIIKEIQKKVF